MINVKKIISIGILVLLTIFIVQNFALVSVSFLFWEITLPRSMILIAVMVIGILIGILVSQPGSKNS